VRARGLGAGARWRHAQDPYNSVPLPCLDQNTTPTGVYGSRSLSLSKTQDVGARGYCWQASAGHGAEANWCRLGLERTEGSFKLKGRAAGG
jgi:hypothetical protein